MRSSERAVLAEVRTVSIFPDGDVVDEAIFLDEIDSSEIFDGIQKYINTCRVANTR